jgi:hypothetical protein
MMATTKTSLHSLMTAQEVADSLITFAQQRPEEYFVLKVARSTDGGEIAEPDLNIRFTSLGGQKTTLADDSEIAHCITDDGRYVDLMLGAPADRKDQLVTVLVEQ